jgi:hypothetical protein
LLTEVLLKPFCGPSLLQQNRAPWSHEGVIAERENQANLVSTECR